MTLMKTDQWIAEMAVQEYRVTIARVYPAFSVVYLQ